MTKLIRLPQTDLNATYARKVSNTLIKHYHVPSVLMHFLGQSPDLAVKEFVAKEIGVADSTNIEIVNSKSPIGLQTLDAPQVLEGLPKIKKQLAKDRRLHKNAFNSCLLQYNGYVFGNTLGERHNIPSGFSWAAVGFALVTLVTYPLNRVIRGLNRVIGLFRIKVRTDGAFFSDEVLYTAPKTLSELPEMGKVRRVSPATYLSVAFNEGQLVQAVEILRSDLQKLSDKKLILGSFSMPKMKALVNVNSCGELSYTLFCFPFLDRTRLYKLVGCENPLLFNKLYPRLEALKKMVDIQSETFEGGIGVDLRTQVDYTIEHVNIINLREEGERGYEQTGVDQGIYNRLTRCIEILDIEDEFNMYYPYLGKRTLEKVNKAASAVAAIVIPENSPNKKMLENLLNKAKYLIPKALQSMLNRPIVGLKPPIVSFTGIDVDAPTLVSDKKE